MPDQQPTAFFGKNTLAGAVVLLLVAGYIEGRVSQGISDSGQKAYQKVIEAQLQNISTTLTQQNERAVKLEEASSIRIRAVEAQLNKWESDILYVQAYRNTGSWARAEDIVNKRRGKF